MLSNFGTSTKDGKSPLGNIVNILDIPIDNLSQNQLLEKLKFGGIVFTPNVDHLIQLQTNPGFRKVYQMATYRPCDSQILVYASKFLGTPIKEKISGSDLFPAFYERYKDDEEIKIFLLGGAEGVAAKAQQRINTKVGRKIIVDTLSPSFGFEKCEKECQNIVDRINQSQATVLAVGLGAPKQEQWICQYKDKLKNIQLFLAIGATIDFEAGNLQRAPKWMSNIGLEWFYRLMNEPRRLLIRYLKDTVFFWWLLKQKIRQSKALRFPLNS
ncbi:MAG: WecB/TagA/CpsF family glycosyltransferase [Chroococcales cyanobacterium]